MATYPFCEPRIPRKGYPITRTLTIFAEYEVNGTQGNDNPESDTNI